MASLDLWIDGCLFQGVIIINTWMGWIGVFVHIDWENDDNDVYCVFFSSICLLRFFRPGMSSVTSLRSFSGCHDDHEPASPGGPWPQQRKPPRPCTRWSDRMSAIFSCSHVSPDGGISNDAVWIVISYGFYLLVMLLAIPFGAGDWFIF
jgi:hypothetical protein